jgi:hypothetical protein
MKSILTGVNEKSIAAIGRDDGDIVHSKRSNNCANTKIRIPARGHRCQNPVSESVTAGAAPSMINLKRILPVLALLLLSACVTAMQPQNYSERFETTWESSNRFVVSYRANPASTEKMVTDLSLLLTAETVLQHGFHYFILVDDTDYANRIEQRHQIVEVTAETGPHYRHASPAATNRIICFHEKPPGFAYVALFVKASLRSRYGLDRTSHSI